MGIKRSAWGRPASLDSLRPSKRSRCSGATLAEPAVWELDPAKVFCPGLPVVSRGAACARAVRNDAALQEEPTDDKTSESRMPEPNAADANDEEARSPNLYSYSAPAATGYLKPTVQTARLFQRFLNGAEIDPAEDVTAIGSWIERCQSAIRDPDLHDPADANPPHAPDKSRELGKEEDDALLGFQLKVMARLG